MEIREVVVQRPNLFYLHAKKYGACRLITWREQGVLLIYRVVAPSEMFDEMARAGIIVLDY